MRRSHHRWQTPHRSPCTRQKAPRISSQGTPALSPEALASFHLSDRASPKAAFPKNACPAYPSARHPGYARRSCASPHAPPPASSPLPKDVRQIDPHQYRSMLNKGKPLKEWAATKHRTRPAVLEYREIRTRMRASPPTPREPQSQHARFRGGNMHRPRTKRAGRCQCRSPHRKACPPMQASRTLPRRRFPRP